MEWSLHYKNFLKETSTKRWTHWEDGAAFSVVEEHGNDFCITEFKLFLVFWTFYTLITSEFYVYISCSLYLNGFDELDLSWPTSHYWEQSLCSSPLCRWSLLIQVPTLGSESASVCTLFSYPWILKSTTYFSFTYRHSLYLLSRKLGHLSKPSASKKTCHSISKLTQAESSFSRHLMFIPSSGLKVWLSSCGKKFPLFFENIFSFILSTISIILTI